MLLEAVQTIMEHVTLAHVLRSRGFGVVLLGIYQVLLAGDRLCITDTCSGCRTDHCQYVSARLLRQFAAL